MKTTSFDLIYDNIKIENYEIIEDDTHMDQYFRKTSFDLCINNQKLSLLFDYKDDTMNYSEYILSANNSQIFRDYSYDFSYYRYHDDDLINFYCNVKSDNSTFSELIELIINIFKLIDK